MVMEGFTQPCLLAGRLKKMKSLGVTCLHIFGVDNCLCKIADPTFVGFIEATNADVGNKCIAKTNPDEKVGIWCMKKTQDGQLMSCVVEYSELSEELRNCRNPDDSLQLSSGNIANHCMRLSFIEKLLAKNILEDMYHIAKKKIPYVDPDSGEYVSPSSPNGIKLESFIFDAFEFADRVVGLEVPREEEFAPIKNACGEDSPDTAKALMTQLHMSWVKKAGGKFDMDGVTAKQTLVEVSPLTSYNGEGLENRFSKVLRPPILIS